MGGWFNKKIRSANDLKGLKMVDKVEHITNNGRKILVVHGDEFDLVTRHSKWVSVFGIRNSFGKLVGLL